MAEFNQRVRGYKPRCGTKGAVGVISLIEMGVTIRYGMWTTFKLRQLTQLF